MKKAFAVLALVVCIVSASVAQTWPTSGWQQDTPESQGVDSGSLADAIDFILARKIPVHSLTIVRHGVMVLDVYFYPYQGGTPHDVASVTKSVTSLVIGIAIDKGYLQNVKQPILPLLVSHPAEPDPFKSTITIENLLTMTSGLNCGSLDTVVSAEPELNEMRHSPDWIAYAVNLPMRMKPGERFAYCSVNNHLLSAIITARTGKSEQEFARENVFEPLGITEFIWPADKQGMTHGWADLHLLPQDMAKMGYLYLHGGQWNGKQIVSQNWVEQSLVSHTPVRPGEGYGYSWWVNMAREPNIPEAAGRGGQRVSLVPDKDSVVVFTAGGADLDEIAPFILRAINADHALPKNPKAYNRLRRSIQAARHSSSRQTNSILPRTAKQISGKVYHFNSNQIDAHDISLFFSQNHEARMALTIGDEQWSGAIGLDGRYRFSDNGHFRLPMGVRGRWLSNEKFLLDINLDANITHLLFGFRFVGDHADVDIKDTTGSIPELKIGASACPKFSAAAASPQ